MNAKNANTPPPILDQEVSNVEFRNAIQLLAKSVANKNNQQVQDHVISNGGSTPTKICDFVKLNSSVLRIADWDLQNFLDGIKKIFEVMQVTKNDRVELASYQLKYVAHILYAWKENRAPPSASVSSSKNKYDQKVRAPVSKSQGSASGTKTYPTYPKYYKNHPGECLARKEGCFGCSQSGHRLRDCPSRQGQGGSYGRAHSTTSATPLSCLTRQVKSFCKGGG
nr:uncharacterized protein LOC101252279 [Solanum lycopersicum]